MEGTVPKDTADLGVGVESLDIRFGLGEGLMGGRRVGTADKPKLRRARRRQVAADRKRRATIKMENAPIKARVARQQGDVRPRPRLCKRSGMFVR